ncbi:MAG: hypothetical protein GTO18_13145 [Anaerolineales bacterium]|nr:hypothetical protein [Anaerolineales bacterium]
MPKRVLVIGLDSAPLDWVRKWADEGRLPGLKRLMDEGASGILQSVNPPLSPSAWASFATGMVPAKHGVFDHIYRRQGTYDIAPTTSATCMEEPVWRIISRHDGRVGVINVPETYPPAPVNGFLISGMDTPSDEAEYTYPSELKSELQSAIGGYKVFGTRSKENLDRSIEGMHETIPMRARAGQYLWDKYRPEFMTLVFMEPDVIQHKCWKYLDPSHPEYGDDVNQKKGKIYRESIPDIYSRIDRAISPWLNSLDDDTTVIVMSDHGAGPLNKFLYINNWLEKEGYLHFKPSVLTRTKLLSFRLGFTPANVFNIAANLRLGVVDRATNKIKRDMITTGRTTRMQRAFLSWTDVDWQRTRAYSLGGNFTGIYINLEGREPEGCVAQGQVYDALCDELKTRLKEWYDQDTGAPIVDRVYTREELHQGPHSDRAPDVIFSTTNEAYVGSGGHEFTSNRLMNTSPLFNGHHRMNGMLIMSGGDVRAGQLEPTNIMDLAPSILYLLGYPIPVKMDGRVITQAVTKEFLAAYPIQFEDTVEYTPLEVDGTYTSEDEREVLTRLSDLGYL